MEALLQEIATRVQTLELEIKQLDIDRDNKVEEIKQLEMKKCVLVNCQLDEQERNQIILALQELNNPPP